MRLANKTTTVAVEVANEYDDSQIMGLRRRAHGLVIAGVKLAIREIEDIPLGVESLQTLKARIIGHLEVLAEERLEPNARAAVVTDDEGTKT